MRLLVLPILVPLGTAAVLMLAPTRPVPQRWISLAGSVLLLASALLIFFRVNEAGVQVLQIGGWPAPFGITLVADLLAAILVVAVGVVGTAISGAAFSGVDPRREAFGYHPLLQILLMGVAGAFLTGDLFNLYVWFEVMLVASFVLMALNRTRPQMEAAFKYVTINLIASSIFLTALGLLYGATGTLNMAELARVWPTVGTPGVHGVLAVLFLIAFSIKAGLFPLFFWLPASYHTPPAAIGAVFAGLLTKVGVYALIRIFTLLFYDESPAHLHASPRDVGGDNGDRTCSGAERARFPPSALVQSRRSHRLYDRKPESPDPGSAGRRHLLRHSSHRGDHKPVSDQRRDAPLASHDGFGRARGPVPRPSSGRCAGDDPHLLAGRRAAVVRLPRQARHRRGGVRGRCALGRAG